MKRRSRKPLPLRWNRRDAMRMAAASAVAVSSIDGISQKARAATGGAMADKLVFVISATGGANIADSFLGVGYDECATASSTENANTHIVFPDNRIVDHSAMYPGIKSVNLDAQAGERSYIGGVGSPYNGVLFNTSDFVNRHGNDLAVVCCETTSVNHLVAQHRMVTGAGVNKGRSIGEQIAEIHGQSLAIPFANMSEGGYLQPGADAQLPDYARGEIVSQPMLFPLSVDGVKGMIGAPTAAKDVVASDMMKARAFLGQARDARAALEQASVFGQTFQCSADIQAYKALRDIKAMDVEGQALIDELLFLKDGESATTLADYGLASSAEALATRGDFESAAATGIWTGSEVDNTAFNARDDAFLQQATLGFLLARCGFSSCVNIGLSFNPAGELLPVNPPISFDFSHTNHVGTQAALWARILDVADKLITLLKATDVPGSGEKMWDRSVVYIATEFGRDKTRKAGNGPATGLTSISTGHHLNNGVAIISPLINGGRVYGGIDNTTLMTHGFDPATGNPTPGSNSIREDDIYSVVTGAAGASFPGQIAHPAILGS